ncbi:50S ribosomal protein L24 [Helicobacter jaachi]|uniref:Large ribosomal subunit protein uL24 n=1 Tax=Helicobacter jaachi TaxID=1677920 RepID=A0A4U8TFS1_9HELI|nr:50S ribosomal protein L24 [Helicobacter jaachi]TLD97547.1 50S ribosomal protein L24 [Helicobacter jaachi]
MAKFKIKKGDMVIVIAGDDKGKEAKVLQVLPKSAQVIVEGCKMSKKAVKVSEKNPKGGFVAKEMPMSISNVKKAKGDS